MKRLPQILLIALLLSAGIVKSQSGTEVYEYATVLSANAPPGNVKPELFISYSNGDFKEIELDKNDVKPFASYNQTAALKYIAQLTKEGWEVINFQHTSALGWAYFLKRKQK